MKQYEPFRAGTARAQNAGNLGSAWESPVTVIAWAVSARRPPCLGAGLGGWLGGRAG
jgi:hypothetical protein